MKTKLTISVIMLGVLTLAFIFNNPSEPTLNPISNTVPPVSQPYGPGANGFLYGSFNSAFDFWHEYDSLGFNMWHLYGWGPETDPNGRHIPPGWQHTFHAPNDGLFADQNIYTSQVQGVLAGIPPYMKAYLNRPKLEWFRFGQRSDYQCEDVDPNPGPGNDLWFYAFNSNTPGRNYTGESVPDNTAYGNGVQVKRCLLSADEAGWVVDRLRSNSEQGLPYGEASAYGDNECTWLIKPRIRIEKDFANTQTNLNKLVCRIDVYSQRGFNPADPEQNKIKSIDLRVRNFKKDQLTEYDGYYLEEFNFGPPWNDTSTQYRQGTWSVGDEKGFFFESRGSRPTDDWDKADIQVYWYGQCNMWIDYVRVDNDIADELLNPNNPFHERDSLWIEWEANNIACYSGSSAQYRYYIELFEFNNIPCIEYVYHKLDSIIYSNCQKHISLVTTVSPHLFAGHVPWENRLSVWNIDYFKRNFLDKTGATEFMLPSYPFTSSYGYPENYPEYPSASNPTWSKIPNSLPIYNTAGTLALAVSPLDYDNWLQVYLDGAPYSLEPEYLETEPRYTNEEDPGQFRYIMQLGDAMNKQTGMPFIFHTSAHSWFLGAGTPDLHYRGMANARGEITGEVQREPTNEELDMISNVSLTYGAKGLIWFQMLSSNSDPGSTRYDKGILDKWVSGASLPPRYTNAYGQAKWNKLIAISDRLQAWEPYIMSFSDDDRHSYIYRIESERNSMYQNSYFSDVFTYKYGTGQYPCAEDFPEGDVPPNNTIGECKNERYLQVATFEKPGEQNNNYFMIVNRRCSPHFEPGEDPRYPDGEYSGYRRIKINLNPNSTQISGFDSWNIIDVENPFGAAIPYHRGQAYVDLGWFEPGQGKLFKMIPTIIDGGILAGDENITGQSFTCEAPVYNNGYNITIGANTTIHFNDSSKFVMSGGVFTVGDQNTSAPQNIISDAVPGGSWRGHSFTNCEVKIYGATFTGLANDTTYAVNVVDCPVVDIRNCTFNTNSSLKGGINAICFNNPFIAINNIYIGSNTFNSSGATIPTVNVSSYAGVTTPLIIENNTFTEGNTAIFLSGVIGGAVKGNIITDNYIAINALTSSIDVVQNNISSTVSGSMGIFAAGGSELKLNSSGIFTLGGLNTISNEGTGTNNINVDGSYFLLDDGENIFNISSDQSSYHLYGYFPMFTAVTTEETNNCFKVNSSPVDPPINMVTSGYQGSQITFNFNPYLTGCENIGGGDGLAIDLGNGIYDTIYTGGSGSGGSQSSVASVRRTDKQTTPSGYAGHPSLVRRGAFTPQLVKEKYDSVCVLMRYRNYSQAKTKCLDLINTYPDSIQSIFAVSKLFLATVASDTSNNAVNTLKIFYENLILNHPNNTSLVKRANYYILKCKVRMREYSQALLGFQQVINQNPYSYEGLIARWDYMATSLLVQGQGGGEPSITNYESGITGNSENDIEGNDDDKKPFTKEQRQDIRKSINTAIEISKNDDEVKIKTLEVKSELGDVNASKELTQMKSLKQVVKTEKPKSIIEHVRIVSEDIRKVFGSSTSSKGNEPKSIPLVFRISQNYPNPFNPVTKINYDLPKDSKVNIVIYDILGREVKRLVNNELKTAGSYIVNFNAMNYASGVYFYRIEAEEPNGNKFVDNRKMVLLK